MMAVAQAQGKTGELQRQVQTKFDPNGLVGSSVVPEVADDESPPGSPASASDGRGLMREVFDQFDEDGGGTIDARELQAAMGAYGVHLSSTEARELIMAADADGSGELDFDEFEELMQRASDKDSMNQLRGTVIEGVGHVRRAVSVSAEIAATTARLQAANTSRDVCEMEAAIAAALALADRASGTSGEQQMRRLIDTSRNRLTNDEELRRSNELRNSDKVRDKIQRLWELVAVESMAIRYEETLDKHAESVAIGEEEQVGYVASPLASGELFVSREGYVAVHMRVAKVLAADQASSGFWTRAEAMAAKDWAADITRFASSSHITVWLSKIRDKFRRASEKSVAVAGFSALFSHYDEDGSGELEQPEFQAAVRSDLHVDEATVPDVELGRLFSAVDQDQSGSMDSKEFLAWLFERPRPGADRKGQEPVQGGECSVGGENGLGVVV
jgi:Ca2+-binding EF-hand superfamily protein